ncbi:MAG TPA: hypothetical protein VLJ44_04410 [Gaiellaceae bacterium]|nr:hypothetical protein [Gaiellaceae bacterium]
MALKILFFVLWVPVAVPAAFVVFRWARRANRVLAVALLAAAIALAGLVVYPRTIKDTAAAAHRFEKLWSANRHRKGGAWDCLTYNFHACVREQVWVDLRNLIPKHDRFYLETNYGLIHFWTFTSLLPRIAVDDPHKADWVIWYRANPARLGVKLGTRHVIRHVYANGSYSIVAARVLE